MVRREFQRSAAAKTAVNLFRNIIVFLTTRSKKNKKVRIEVITYGARSDKANGYNVKK